MNKGFFFDRDGILNKLVYEKKSTRPPYNLSELDLNYEIFDSIKSLKNDFMLFIVSNQPDVKRGNLKLDELTKINEKINSKLHFTEILCETEDNSLHKKPNPHMLNNLIKKYDIDKLNSWIIGDRWVDIEAGFRAGIKTILHKNKYSFDETSAGLPNKTIKPDIVIETLEEFNSLITNKFQK
jgi:D-glycero-D-manno-heptose 1,7-bisphosphate phosphatase